MLYGIEKKMYIGINIDIIFISIMSIIDINIINILFVPL